VTISYQKALKELSGATNYENLNPKQIPRLSLEPMRHLMDALGHPAQGIPLIHIAGTKGKGSTACLAGALLREAGYRVGVYSSPHLISPCERICINGKSISERDFSRLAYRISEVAQILEDHHSEIKPSWFDRVTAMALLHFEEKKVDVIVLETGLGGRWDSTNICNSSVSVITRLDDDHRELLGGTLESIALEKCGIIREGVPVISLRQHKKMFPVLQRTAEKKKAPLKILTRDFFLSLKEEGMEFSMQGYHLKGLRKKAHGKHQWENAALALMSVVTLSREKNWKLSKQSLHCALKNTEVPGRLQYFGNFLLDGAHNPVSMRALTAFLREKNLWNLDVVFATQLDKNVAEVLDILSPHVGRFFCVSFSSGRALPANELADKAKRFFSSDKIHCPGDLKQALELSISSSKTFPVLLTGSLYLVGDFLRLKQNGKKGSLFASEGI
jgi:dihydrofolate synthase/folylpolyglutamate synthase